MKRKYLLDTHALIWFLEGDEILPVNIRKIIIDTDNNISVSIATLWEMAIKISIKKISLSRTLSDIINKMAEDRINILPIEIPAILQLLSMPFFHKDPFDRVIIAQCLIENLTVVSNEQLFDNYGVIRIW